MLSDLPHVLRGQDGASLQLRDDVTPVECFVLNTEQRVFRQADYENVWVMHALLRGQHADAFRVFAERFSVQMAMENLEDAPELFFPARHGDVTLSAIYCEKR